MIIDGWKDGTKKQYSNAFTTWERFCKKADINPLEGNIKYGLDFLYSIYAESNSYSMVNTCRSALSSFIRTQTHKCGEDPLVCKFMQSIHLKIPPTPKYSNMWDIHQVLEPLRKWYPNDKLSLKLLTIKLVFLMAITNMQRLHIFPSLSTKSMIKTKDKATFIPATHPKVSKRSRKVHSQERILPQVLSHVIRFTQYRYLYFFMLQTEPGRSRLYLRAIYAHPIKIQLSLFVEQLKKFWFLCLVFI